MKTSKISSAKYKKFFVFSGNYKKLFSFGTFVAFGKVYETFSGKYKELFFSSAISCFLGVSVKNILDRNLFYFVRLGECSRSVHFLLLTLSKPVV